MTELLEEIKRRVGEFANGYGLTIVKTLALLSVGVLIISIFAKRIKKSAVKSRKVDRSASTFITSIVKLVLYVFWRWQLFNRLAFQRRD